MAERSLGPYRLLSALRDEAGRAHLAWDTRLNQHVRILELDEFLPGSWPDADRHRRFLERVRSLSRLRHPALIVPIDAAPPGSSSLWYATEPPRGMRLDRLQRAMERLPWQEAALIAHEVAGAVGYAHARGLAHGQLHAGRVLIGLDGEVQVDGFDLRWDTLGPDNVSRTPGRVLLERPSAAAPERMLAGAPTPPADVFAIGVMLYELVVGRQPFEAATAVREPSRTHRAPPLGSPALRALPHALRGLVEELLAPAPESRLQTGGAVRERIGELLHASSGIAKPRVALAAALRAHRGLFVAAGATGEHGAAEAGATGRDEAEGRGDQGGRTARETSRQVSAVRGDGESSGEESAAGDAEGRPSGGRGARSERHGASRRRAGGSSGVSTSARTIPSADAPRLPAGAGEVTRAVRLIAGMAVGVALGLLLLAPWRGEERSSSGGTEGGTSRAASARASEGGRADAGASTATLGRPAPAEPERGARYADKARRLLEAGRPVSAEDMARAGLREPGGSEPELHTLLARALVRQGEREAAVEAHLRADEAAPGRTRGRLEAAELLLEAERCQRAVELLEAILGARERSRRLHALLGRCRLRLGRTGEAVSSLRRAVAGPDADPELRLALARALEETGRPEEAETVYRGLKDAGAYVDRARRGLKRVLAESGDPAAALGADLQAGPDDEPASSSELATEAHAAFRAGRYADAAERYERAIEAAEGEPTAKMLRNRAVALHRAGEDEEARRAYARALEAKPDDGELHALYGELLHEAGETDEAVRHLERAVELEPERWRASLRLGRIALDEGRAEDAVRAFERVAGQRPDDVRAWRHLGRAQLDAGRPGAAADAFRHLVALEPENPRPVLTLAQLMQRMNRSSEAAALRREACRRGAREACR